MRIRIHELLACQKVSQTLVALVTKARAVWGIIRITILIKVIIIIIIILIIIDTRSTA